MNELVKEKNHVIDAGRVLKFEKNNNFLSDLGTRQAKQFRNFF